MNGTLADLRKQLVEVTRELARMPEHLAGSEWQRDRVDEADWLHRTIARMERADANRKDMETRLAYLKREVATAGPSRFGTDWMHDRRREIEAIEGRLALMS